MRPGCQRRPGGWIAAAARQPLEAPEGDQVRLAASLARERLLAEAVAPAPEDRRRRRLPAMRTDQREVSRTPAHHEIPKPVHAIPFTRSSFLQGQVDKHHIIRPGVVMCDQGQPASRSGLTCGTCGSTRTARPFAKQPQRALHAACRVMPHVVRRHVAHATRGSPAMNKVPAPPQSAATPAQFG